MIHPKLGEFFRLDAKKARAERRTWKYLKRKSCKRRRLKTLITAQVKLGRKIRRLIDNTTGVRFDAFQLFTLK